MTPGALSDNLPFPKLNYDASHQNQFLDRSEAFISILVNSYYVSKGNMIFKLFYHEHKTHRNFDASDVNLAEDA